jgi:hypothetical protein
MRADVLVLAGVDTSWANGEFSDLDGGVAWRLRDFISDAGTGGVDHDAQTTWRNSSGGQIAPKEYFWADDEKYGKDQIHGGVMGDYESKAGELDEFGGGQGETYSSHHRAYYEKFSGKSWGEMTTADLDAVDDKMNAGQIPQYDGDGEDDSYYQSHETQKKTKI